MDGSWSAALGLEGMVEADALRALVDGNDPISGMPLLVGLRERSVKAFDLTFSAPKSVSLLWALGSEPVADVVMGAHREAVAAALGFLEERAALARVQVDGVRRHVPTEGWAVAGFVHRTSRAGDPQLHTHCRGAERGAPAGRAVCGDRGAADVRVGPRRRVDLSGRVATAAQFAVGGGVAAGSEQHPRDRRVRPPTALRTFSKRTVEIEAELEATGARYESPVLRMRADDEASLATRPAKDHTRDTGDAVRSLADRGGRGRPGGRAATLERSGVLA